MKVAWQEDHFGHGLNREKNNLEKLTLLIDDDFNVHAMNHKLTHPKLSTRIYGGIPAFYSMGDINQLPSVFMKSIADDSQISSNNADGVGNMPSQTS